jgi:rfaE bifunctional protein kinase chain/domain
MNTDRFNDLLNQFSEARVAVLGDFFLDLYIIMDRALSEFSLETHKEAFQAVEIRGQAGTAGVTTNNLRALGAQTAAIGVTGTDGNGHTLRQALTEKGVETQYLVARDDRFTITYTKPLMQEVDGSTIELNRIDILNRFPNPQDLNQQLAEHVRRAVADFDGILVVEQVAQDGFGTLSPLLRETLSHLAEAYAQKTFLVDSRHHAAAYAGIAMKMNRSEAAAAARALGPLPADLEDRPSLEAAEICARMFWNAHQQPIFITLGENGICGINQGQFFHIPGYHTQGPVDIVGAGDATLAGIGLALCCGATPREAAYIGNLVGSITVEQIGTTGIATREDLQRRHHEYQQQQPQ